MKVLIVCWAMALCLGFGALARYDQAAGAQREAPSQLVLATNGKPHLTVFIHPECGCTSATLGELERIDAQTNGCLDITVDAVIPAGNTAWKRADNVTRAQANRDWHTILDTDGKVAASMGAQTSGFCLLADAHGKKVFQGGITEARGHEGDNAGHDAIVEFVNRGTVAISSTPVFGCSLGELGANW